MAAGERFHTPSSAPQFRRTEFIRMPNGRFQMRKGSERLHFEDLKADEMLTASDLQTYFGCGLRTLRRWVSEEGLKPDGFYRHQLLFYKATVLRWENAHKPKRGRPRIDRSARAAIDPVEALRRRLLGVPRAST